MNSKRKLAKEPKVLLYYKFIKVKDPETTMLWQRALCESLNLKGRIIISKHGINGTLGGALGDCKAYVKSMNKHSEFKGIKYKWSAGSKDSSDFPKLSVKVRKELVTLDPDHEFDVFDKSKGLSPEAWHNYLNDNPDTIILDARNNYESEIGAFKSSSNTLIKPDIESFREIKDHLSDIPKEKPVLTYCTGDVRCEYLSAYMKSKGFKEVYHLEGGIIKYGQKYGQKGFWDGKCFTFDNRMKLDFASDDNSGNFDIADCRSCGKKTSEQINCGNTDCNHLQVICLDCQSKGFKCINCGQEGHGRDGTSTSEIKKTSLKSMLK